MCVHGMNSKINRIGGGTRSSNFDCPLWGLQRLPKQNILRLKCSDFFSFVMCIRNIYHCPFCNICRVGRGLGIDYFHCMPCNCCLSMNLVKHKCRERCLETNCPVCNEFLFTSTAVIKALPCGHYIHSACLRVLYISLTLFLFLL